MVSPKLAQILHEVVGERVVVVENEDHDDGNRSGLRARVELAMHTSKILTIHVRVDLCRRDIGVAKHFLNSAQVGAAFKEVRRKRMAQRVRRNSLFNAGLHHVFAQEFSRRPFA